MAKLLHGSITLVLVVVLLSSFSTKPAMAKDTSPSLGHSVVAKAWCGRLSSYTTWYYSSVEKTWKPILYIWKGKGKGNPYAVSVYFDGKTVPNAGSGVQTFSGPQVDLKNGWVGYFIAKRFYFTHLLEWDDDWRWEVRGCIP